MPDSIVGVNFDYTYNGVLSTDVLFKPTVNTPAISDLMTIRQFARYKEQIPLLNSSTPSRSISSERIFPAMVWLVM